MKYSILVGAVLLACGVISEAQQAKKVARVGYLIVGSSTNVRPRVEAFRQGLRELGYQEEKNINIEYRYGENNLESLADLAAGLVSLKVDVIVASGGAPTRAAKSSTKAIPIVMINISDPVALGFVDSLAKPGGNITGLAGMQTDLGGKRLELLKEVAPKISRVAVLVNKDVPGYALQIKEIESAAGTLGLQLQALEIRGPKDLTKALDAITAGRAGALMGTQNPIFSSLRRSIVEFAIKNRLPTVHGDWEFTASGGLLSYGPDTSDMYRRAAVYVDKILKGAKAADIPVEQPMKFDFVINLRTAKQIGLEIPQWTLMKADRVIK